MGHRISRSNTHGALGRFEKQTLSRKSYTEFWVLIPIALIVTMLAAFWAWTLASSQFAAAPAVRNPGVIFVATYNDSANRNKVYVFLKYQMTGNRRSTTYLELSAIQEKVPEASKTASAGVIFFLCGSADLHPQFTLWSEKKVTWHSAAAFGQGYGVLTDYYDFPKQCIYAAIPLDRSSPTGYSGVVMSGSSGPAPNSISGAGITYEWPGIQNLPGTVSNGSITASPLSSNSTYSVDFYYPPDDFSNVVSDPDVTATTAGFAASGLINDSPDPQFRISGQLSDSQARIERDFFIAGALVGVAGGGAIWALELLAKFFLTLTGSRESAEGAADMAAKDQGASTEPAMPNHVVNSRWWIRIFRR